MQLLNKHNLAVAEFSSKEESRHTLCAVHMNAERTAATNGHYLCTVTLPKTRAEQFPTVEGFDANGFEPCLLTLDTVKAVAKALPKNCRVPILKHAAVSVNAEGAVQIATTDLDSASVVRQKKTAGQFPNGTDAVLNPPEPPVLTIGFNAKYLAQIAKAAAAFTDNHASFVRLKFYGPDKAMIFEAENKGTGQVMRGALMPCRG